MEKGKIRITVLAPDGKINVFEVNRGEGAFALASHFHNIENIGNEDVEVIAFFSNATPDYIGIGEVIGSYTNDELSSIFKVPPTYFNVFKKNKRSACHRSCLKSFSFAYDIHKCRTFVLLTIFELIKILLRDIKQT